MNFASYYRRKLLAGLAYFFLGFIAIMEGWKILNQFVILIVDRKAYEEEMKEEEANAKND